MICPFMQEHTDDCPWISCMETECALWVYDERGHGLCTFTSIAYQLAAMREGNTRNDNKKSHA